MKEERLFKIILSFLFTVLVFQCEIFNPQDESNKLKNYSIEGYIQKGPFITGSQVTIQELSDDLSPTGNVFNVETKDDFGSFSTDVDLASNYVEIIAKGFYFNEVTGKLSEANLTLKAVSDLSQTNEVYVNVLTTLEANRIKYLIKNNNMSFLEARKKAEMEILNIFNIEVDSIAYFDQMDISREGESNAILLAASCILQGTGSVAELSELISKISLDIESDGTLDNQKYKDKIIENSMSINLDSIRINLENRYSYLGLDVKIPNFEDFVDSDGDGYLNLYETKMVFNPITDAELSTEYISNAIYIKLPPDIQSASAKVDNGTIVLNGEDTGSKIATVQYGDSVQIKLISSDNYNTEVSATFSILNNSGTFSVKTKKHYGAYWTLATSSAPWSPRCCHTSVVFNDKIWVIGGYAGDNKFLNDVWYSSDGINWYCATDSADWFPRYGHTSIVFDNKIWVIGGMALIKANNNFKVMGMSDVWYSEDGITWTCATDSAGWKPFTNAPSSLVFDNKIWIVSFSDIWCSHDGVEWRFADSEDVLQNSRIILFNDRIWAISSVSIWFSYDWNNWELLISISSNDTLRNAISRTFNTCISLDNEILVIGGYSYPKILNDVWYSSDGINWYCATDSADWCPRYGHTTVVFDDKIWIIGGRESLSFEGHQEYHLNDVWYSPIRY